jgi:hypothetical protein
MKDIINKYTQEILSQIADSSNSTEDLECFIRATLGIVFAGAILSTKEACKEAIKPFIYQHIVIQELRDLYLSKIDGAEVCPRTRK